MFIFAILAAIVAGGAVAVAVKKTQAAPKGTVVKKPTSTSGDDWLNTVDRVFTDIDKGARTAKSVKDLLGLGDGAPSTTMSPSVKGNQLIDPQTNKALSFGPPSPGTRGGTEFGSTDWIFGNGTKSTSQDEDIIDLVGAGEE